MSRRPVLVVCCLFVAGCGAVSQSYTVEPIARPETTRPAPVAAPASSGAAATARADDVGNWFVRQVSNPEYGSRKEYAFEIIYCPTDRGDFSRCRTAVVWSRGTKGGLGAQSDAPESVVVDPPRPRSPRRDSPPPPPPAAAVASPPTTASATPPPSPLPAPSPVSSVVTAGADFDSLSSDALARMRSWTGRAVEVTTKSGKTVTGMLRHVRAEGVAVERGGKTSMVDWTDIQSVATVAQESEP